jgi:hypothetical protein
VAHDLTPDLRPYRPRRYGEVTLAGTVDSRATKRRAEDIDAHVIHIAAVFCGTAPLRVRTSGS